jgi:hypothetical protein
MSAAFPTHRMAALALLNGDHRLTHKGGQFLGGISVNPAPLSEAQRDWLDTLLERAGLPPLVMEAARG